MSWNQSENLTEKLAVDRINIWCVQVVVIYKNTPSTQDMDHFTILKNPFNLFNWSAVCTIDYGKSLGYNYLNPIRKHIVKFTNHFNSCSLQGNKLDVRILFDISCLPHKCKKFCLRASHALVHYILCTLNTNMILRLARLC